MHYQFTEDLVTGNPLIDSEHKTFIQAANNVMDNLSDGTDSAAIMGTIQFLSNYAKTHFKHEEELQKKTGYPDIVAHKKWHRNFETEIETIAKDITTNGISSAAVVELTRKMSILLNHIRTQDKKIALHISKSS